MTLPAPPIAGESYAAYHDAREAVLEERIMARVMAELAGLKVGVVVTPEIEGEKP